MCASVGDYLLFSPQRLFNSISAWCCSTRWITQLSCHKAIGYWRGETMQVTNNLIKQTKIDNNLRQIQIKTDVQSQNALSRNLSRHPRAKSVSLTILCLTDRCKMDHFRTGVTINAHIDLSPMFLQSAATFVVWFLHELLHYERHSACSTLIYIPGLTLLFVMGITRSRGRVIWYPLIESRANMKLRNCSYCYWF